MPTSINERILQLIKALNMSQNAFAKSLNTSSSRISNICTYRNKPDFEILERIVLTFSSVNAEWLLTGMGEVFKDAKDEISEENKMTLDSLLTITKSLKEEIEEMRRDITRGQK